MWTSGTATDYRDLLARLRQFVTTDMTPAGERWTELRWETTATTQELLLKGPGLAGVDEIYVGIRSYENANSGWYWWDLQGLTGHVSNLGFYAQPGADSQYPVGLPLWQYSIPYWFFANGRRIVIVAKVGTSYETGYLGFMLPYATPQEHFYPMFVGGTQTPKLSRMRFESSDGHRAFFNTKNTDADMVAARIWMAGAWEYVMNTSPSADVSMTYPYVLPEFASVGHCYDGSHILIPVQYMRRNALSLSQRHWFGALDGVFFVSGMNNAAENIVTVSGADYFVVQNCHRTAWNEHAAIRMA